MLALTATVLGFVYTASTESGLFGPSPELTRKATAAGANAPAMISPDEADSLFESGQALFIDARHEFDYKAGHIRGAINIPLKEFDTYPGKLASVQKSKTIVPYCDGAECNSSIELASKLYAAGFTNVKIFFGGWREWQARHLPVEGSPQ